VETCLKTECIPFTAIPHNSRLFLDFFFDFDKTSAFYAHRPQASAVLENARTLNFPAERRVKVADVLERQNRQWGASAATLASIERLRNGAVACISGQQVGVFGGPLYSLLKAVSALQMAEELTSKGVPAVPIFWLATEDHDLAEIAAVTLRHGSELETFTATAATEAGGPVGPMPLAEGITAMVERATELLGPGWVSDALRQSYRPGESFGSAFARLFTRLLSGTGMILVDPLDDELHAIAQPILSAAAERAEELNIALLERGKQLHQAGYHEQVRVTPESTLLFSLEGRSRTVLHLAGSDFMLGAARQPRQQVLDNVRQHPEAYSPNVLLRPVVQDYLFPTAVYFGGPAEIAYFAQAAVVYEKLLGRSTPVLPRLSATLMPPEVSALLERYGVSFLDLFHGNEKLCELLASRTMPASLRQALTAANQSLETNLAAVRAELQSLDPTLVDAAARSERKMRYQLGKIGAKAARAQLRRTPTVAEDAHLVLSGLFPHKGLQERTLPGIEFLAQYGPELIATLKQVAASGCPGHQIIRL